MVVVVDYSVSMSMAMSAWPRPIPSDCLFPCRADEGVFLPALREGNFSICACHGELKLICRSAKDSTRYRIGAKMLTALEIVLAPVPSESRLRTAWGEQKEFLIFLTL